MSTPESQRRKPWLRAIVFAVLVVTGAQLAGYSSASVWYVVGILLHVVVGHQLPICACGYDGTF